MTRIPRPTAHRPDDSACLLHVGSRGSSGSARAAVTALLLAIGAAVGNVQAGTPDPSQTGYAGRTGTTIYVSKHGDGTDGASWKTAFTTIQAGLDAVPDDKGGHRVIVRPDVYVEANLAPAHRGAEGAYNALICDYDGTFDSGATGWAVIDAGDPELGFKSWDWWGTIRASNKHWPVGNNRETFSSIVWDRWALHRLYTSGGDAGFFWDLTNKSGESFTVLVEDCVGIGRAFGGGVVYPKVRPDEPTVFRRCYFLALDWDRDTAAVLVGGSEDTLPEFPHAVLDDCTLVHPDNAIALSYAGRQTRAKLIGCRLIALNFTQPEMGGKSTGIICTENHADGGALHVDLQDCRLAGYSVFTPGPDSKRATLATTGRNTAYLQFKQPTPEGFERVGAWPADLFALIAPPSATSTPPRPKLIKLPFAFERAMENTPFVFNGRPYLVLNHRDDTKVHTDEYGPSMYVYIKDLITGKEVSRFAKEHSFASAVVDESTLHVFGSKADKDWFHEIRQFTSTNLQDWSSHIALEPEPGEALLNVSVCKDDRGWLMAYESNKPVQFCFKFARSEDLHHWEKIPGLTFTGVNNEYSACPVLRYFAPYYYAIYLHAAIPGHNGWVSFLARSKDLADWELSPLNPILEATKEEGINNSDVDLFEWEGRTYLVYATGDQATWASVRMAQFNGPMKTFFQSYFPTGQPLLRANARR